MILQYTHLHRRPALFKAMTGLLLAEFEALAWDLLPQIAAAPGAHPRQQTRQRAVGGGHPYTLSSRDQLLLTIVWLRQYPTYEALGYFFGVSDTTAGRAIKRVLPLLEQAGKDTMRLPDPGRKHRPSAEQILAQTPELALPPALDVVVDSFEQRVQRPADRAAADTYYSGKKKMHTLKSQVAVEGRSGEIVDIPESVRGPTADLTLLKGSGLLERLPPDCSVGADLGYPGLPALSSTGHIPRRKPRGQPRPAADVLYNTAFARQRIIVEHTIGRLRRYAALTQTDRHHRCLHTARVRAVAGLVNRHLRRARRHRAA
jgi:hypothetical protein